MNISELKANMIVAVNVPTPIPDRTDPAFGCMRDGVLRVQKVGEGWFEYEVVDGTAYHVGASGSIPFKYLPYCEPFNQQSGAEGTRLFQVDDEELADYVG